MSCDELGTGPGSIELRHDGQADSGSLSGPAYLDRLAA